MTKVNFYLTTLFLICSTIITGYAFQIVPPDKCDYADWYKEKIPNCNGCITSVELIEFKGKVLVAFWADNPFCSDAQTVIYNCDGTVFCKEGGILGLTQCSEAGVVTDKKLKPNYTVIKTIWDQITDCEPKCCVNKLDFIDRVNGPLLTNAPDLKGCTLKFLTTALTSCDHVVVDYGDKKEQFIGNFSATHTYDTPGTYTVCLHVVEINNNEKCWQEKSCFKVNAFCEPDICCVDYAAFVDRTEDVTISSKDCDLNLKIPLTDCDEVKIQWEKGAPLEPYTGNIDLTHTYPATDTYEICLYFTEFDKGGEACWEAADCFKVDINCEPDICCVDYAAFVDRTEDVTISSKDCDLNLKIPLTNCDQVKIQWEKGAPLETYTGNINLTHTYQATGTYEICLYFTEFDKSGKACWEAADCFKVDINCEPGICCVDYAAFVDRTEDVTITSKDCDLNLKIPLTDCDEVKIQWEKGAPLETYTGNINLTHTYQATGTYEICLYFTEFDNGGEACWEAADCFEVDVNCCCAEVEALQDRVSFLEEMVVLLNEQFEELNKKVANNEPAKRLHIYPNPSSGDLAIEYFIDEYAKNAELAITNTEGIEVSTTKVSCKSECRSDIKLPNNLSAGIYYCTLYVNDNLIESVPFVYKQ